MAKVEYDVPDALFLEKGELRSWLGAQGIKLTDAYFNWLVLSGHLCGVREPNRNIWQIHRLGALLLRLRWELGDLPRMDEPATAPKGKRPGEEG